MLTIGNISIQIFSLMIGLGAAIGLLWSTLRVSVIPESAQERLNFGVIALSGALLGGRITYVSVNWLYFQQHRNEIFQIWLGGISWGGSLAGSLAFVIIAAIIFRRPIGIILDGLLPLLTSIVISSWLTSWMTGHAYGIDVNAWWGIPARDEWGQVATRWPTQLVGAISTLGIHWSIDQIRFRKWLLIPGLAASFELGLVSLTILGLSSFRGDPAPFYYGIRLDTWASLVFLILSFIIGTISWVKYASNQPTNE